jgi:hypothetical protein
LTIRPHNKIGGIGWLKTASYPGKTRCTIIGLSITTGYIKFAAALWTNHFLAWPFSICASEMFLKVLHAIRINPAVGDGAVTLTADSRGIVIGRQAMSEVGKWR